MDSYPLVERCVIYIFMKYDNKANMRAKIRSIITICLFYCFAGGNAVSYQASISSLRSLLLSVTISSFRQEGNGDITSRNSVNIFKLQSYHDRDIDKKCVLWPLRFLHSRVTTYAATCGVRFSFIATASTSPGFKPVR